MFNDRPLDALLALPLLACALTACAFDSARDDLGRSSTALSEDLIGDLAARGAMSCDFDLPATMDATAIGPIIERDRMYMSARPGFVREIIPMFVAPLALRIQTGGRYLFSTPQQASNYLAWVQDDFILDGTSFFDRDYFLDPVCRSWTVIGATYFTDANTHDLIRTERFTPPRDFDRFPEMVDHWEEIRERARSRGLAGVTFAYNRAERLLEIVHIADRDVLDILALGISPTLGIPLLEDEHCTRSFDRTELVLTEWYPFVAGDRGRAARWPNSPPIPGPRCGDGVCEPSRGETGTSCASDCRPHCGDATCQSGEGENTQVCPSDCRI